MSGTLTAAADKRLHRGSTGDKIQFRFPVGAAVVVVSTRRLLIVKRCFHPAQRAQRKECKGRNGTDVRDVTQ